MERKIISAEEFDRLFDEGSDEIDKYVDWDSMRRVHPDVEKMEIEVPKAMIGWLDEEAKRQGITRSELLRKWLFERFDAAA